MSNRRGSTHRFAVGSASGARSQAWAVGPRRRREPAAPGLPTPSESTVFVGPARQSRAVLAPVQVEESPWRIAVPEPVEPEPVAIRGPEHLPERRLGAGWQVGAVIIVAPFAVDTASPSATGDPAPAVHHPLPWPGRVVHVIVALAGPDALPLALAPNQDGGALVQPGVGQIRLWVTYVTHQPLSQRRIADLRLCGGATPGFARASAPHGYPVLLDLGHG